MSTHQPLEAYSLRGRISRWNLHLRHWHLIEIAFRVFQELLNSLHLRVLLRSAWLGLRFAILDGSDHIVTELDLLE